MPRSIWNGTITLGLTAVPIKVHSATEDRAIRFHQVHEEDGARIRQKRICSVEGVEVPYQEVAKGYPLDDGTYVLLTADEIASAAGERSRVIALEEFVGATKIDPVQYEKSYYLGAGDAGQSAYRLLHAALSESDKVGIGRWVFHNREYLVAIRALDGVLAMHTMRFADELVEARSLDIPEPAHAPTEREVEMAKMLVDALHGEFDPSAYEDSYRDRVMALIACKAAGEEPELPSAPEPKPAPDLMAALEASLAAAGSKQSKRRSTSKPKQPTVPRPKAKPKSKAGS